MTEEHRRPYHSMIEDLTALLTGCLFVSFGMLLLKDQGLLTGGTVGIALAVHNLTDWPLGLVFFTINLPFYWLAVAAKGWRFTIKTLIMVSLVSLLTDNLHFLVLLQTLHPAFAAVMGGIMVGSGMLIQFRHGASMGGIGILALYLQERFGLSAGGFQMAVDVIVVGSGFLFVPLPLLAYSVLGVLAVNQVIALNHKPGRYQIT